MSRSRSATLSRLVAAFTLTAASLSAAGVGQSRVDDIVVALRAGGHVLVMRHASSPREAPDKNAAQPVGDVVSSPTYRALETVRLARLSRPQAVVELGDGGQSMQGVSEAQGEWLRSRAAQAPQGANTVIVTHLPNLTRAFPDWGPTVSDGETVVLRPDGKGGAAVVGRIPIEAWPRMR